MLERNLHSWKKWLTSFLCLKVGGWHHLKAAGSCRWPAVLADAWECHWCSAPYRLEKEFLFCPGFFIIEICPKQGWEILQSKGLQRERRGKTGKTFTSSWNEETSSQDHCAGGVNLARWKNKYRKPTLGVVLETSSPLAPEGSSSAPCQVLS